MVEDFISAKWEIKFLKETISHVNEVKIIHRKFNFHVRKLETVFLVDCTKFQAHEVEKF